MVSVTGDFSKGRVSLVILKLGLPMMLAEFVHVLYNIVDRMYIGHMAEGGTLALTGLGICFPLITLIGAFANLFSTGGATLATIARGAKEDRKAERIMGTSFSMLLIIGLVLTGLLYLTAPVTLRWLGGDDETIPAAMGYFRIYVLGTVPVLISLGMNPFIGAQGFPKIGMGTVLIGAAMNIVLDPLMIFTMGMGIRGAALATVVSQTAGAVWVLGFLRSRRAVLPDGTPHGRKGTEKDCEPGRDRVYLPGNEQHYAGNREHYAEGLGRTAEHDLCGCDEPDQFPAGNHEPAQQRNCDGRAERDELQLRGKTVPACFTEYPVHLPERTGGQPGNVAAGDGYSGTADPYFHLG